MACDLLDAQRTRAIISALRPDVVIHAQALSDVDQCEVEPDAAQTLNVQTIANVVQALAAEQALLICVSTDYVFDGKKGRPYDETDEPNPINVYGRSKLEAERQALGYPRAVIVRTSTLFGAGRMNFCDHIVQQLTSGQPIEAFVDQVTSPTYTVDLAEGIGDLCAVLMVSRALQPRVVHMANAGECSRFTFAQRVRELLGCPVELVQPIPMAHQRRPAARPRYSALTTIRVPQVIRRTLRSWDDALQAYLRARHLRN